MTVSELIAALQALPGDMKVQVMTSEGDGPTDIVQVSRGSWADEDLEEDEEFLAEGDSDWATDGEFIQDDEGGKIAVLVTW
jgi:hypothetical protein